MDATRLRKFELHSCLGQGGFGEVYRATMTSPGGVRSTVAVKVLREGLDMEHQAVQRLRDEARLLGALDHPAILRVHDLTVLDERLALVTEYVDGQDLEGCFEFGPGVPLKVLVEVVGRIAGALDHAWNGKSPLTGERLRLVHRDVKPQNIRVGKHGNVKLLDLGVARAAGVLREAETHPDAMLGTYRYMAPEAFDGDRNDPAVDVYALGVTFFKGVAGEAFWAKRSLRDQAIICGRPETYAEYLAERIGKLPGITSEGVKELLSEMLAYDASGRPDPDGVRNRCNGLIDELSGLDLRRWCEARTWPPEGMGTGGLVGRELTEAPLERAEGEVEQAPPPSKVETVRIEVPLPEDEEDEGSSIAFNLIVSCLTGVLVVGVGATALGLAMVALWAVWS